MIAPAEEHLNRLLRRIDWRFVLNNSRPATSICLSDSGLAQAVAMISDQVKGVDSEACAECDLAVIAKPDANTLEAAWAALKPGGTLYAEWHEPIGRVQQALESAGFQDVQCYWSWPPSDRTPLFWAPLNARGAWHYLLTSRPPDRQRLRHWARWLLRSAAYLIQCAGWLMPVHALAHKPDTIGDTTLIDWLRAHWLDWQLGPLPENLSLLLLTGGKHHTNKIVALVFSATEAQPCLVVKMPRVVESNAGLQREAAMLQALQAHCQTALPGVPQIVFCEERNAGCLLGETALGGVPLFTQLKRHNYRTWALKATDWLIELANHPLERPHDRSRLIEPVLQNFEESFGPSVNQYDIQATRQILARITALPMIVEQRDFSPWNVLITNDGKLAVLDWESAELEGWPGLDLIYFLTHLAFFSEGAMDSGKFVEAYQASLDESTFVGRINAECFSRYGNAVGFDPAEWPALRLMTWLIHTRSDYTRLTREAGGRPTAAELRQSLFVRLWETDLHHGR